MGRVPPPPKKRGFQLPVNQVVCGSNIEVVSEWFAECVDGVVTDPPYGLGFMGKDWDTFNPDTVQRLVKSSIGTGEIGERGRNDTSPAWNSARYDHSRSGHIGFQQWFTIWAEAMLRICKPGAMMFCFGGTRTYHRLACAIEDAGWEIRDCMMWLYGSGFPKSHNIGKKVDGWNGYGTALKPAWEPIIIAMKPLDGTFANNAEKYGVAGLNIDGGRIGTEKRFNQKAGNPTDRDTAAFHAIPNPHNYQGKECQGRWPANLILDEEAGKMLDEQQSNTSRFFYCAKVSKKERNLGMEDQKNNHPTVKPVSLIKYLCTLLKMPNQNQIILDPFMGSGTTGMACKELGINFIGIEKETEYCEIARKRIKAM